MQTYIHESGDTVTGIGADTHADADINAGKNVDTDTVADTIAHNCLSADKHAQDDTDSNTYSDLKRLSLLHFKLWN